VAGARLRRHRRDVVPRSPGGVGRRLFRLELQRHPRHRRGHGDRVGDAAVRRARRSRPNLHGRLGWRALPLPRVVDGPRAGGPDQPLVRAPGAR